MRLRDRETLLRREAVPCSGYLGEIRLINSTPRDERVREVRERVDYATKYRLLKS